MIGQQNIAVPYPASSKNGERSYAMLTKFTKVVAVLALLAGLFSRAAADYRTGLLIVVWAAALVVLAQAFSRSNYFWMGVFLGVACLFNPIRPILLSASLVLILDVSTAILFMISLAALRSKPRLSIASITGPASRSESL
jgi:hypothetical protein